MHLALPCQQSPMMCWHRGTHMSPYAHTQMLSDTIKKDAKLTHMGLCGQGGSYSGGPKLEV